LFLFHLIRLQTFIPWSPVVDGDEVPCQPIACFEKRIIASPVPLIIGTTTEEARPFVYGALEKPLPWYVCVWTSRPAYGVSE
jgi:hypothetical protein